MKKRCHICGKAFTAQGLNGHLRFKHGLDRESASDNTETASLDLSEEASEVFDILDALDEIEERLTQLEKRDQSRFFGKTSNKVIQRLEDGLLQRKQDLEDRLRELGVLPARRKKGMFPLGH